MKELKAKIRLIYIPFLLILLGIGLVYTFLNWLLIIKLELFSLKENVVNLWLPMALSWAPILIWLRPRIKLLRFETDKGLFAFYLFTWMAIMAPTLIAQEYLQTATGKLTALENISQFDKKTSTRYYTIQQYFIDKAHMRVRFNTTTSGRYNNNLNFTLYVAVPILDSEADTSKGNPVYWLCKIYSKTISNNLSGQKKTERYKEFMEKAQLEIDTTNFARFTYLEKTGNSELHDQFNETIRNSDFAVDHDVIAFTAESGAYTNRGDKKLWAILIATVIGCIVVFIPVLTVSLSRGKAEKFDAGVPNRDNDNDSSALLSLFIPRKDYWATPLIVCINIILYLIMVFCGLGVMDFRAIDLLHWGGNFRPSTTNGQYWRLLTSIFLHGGAFHLLTNMAGLMFAGVLLEPALGSRKFLFAYLLSGILASCASMWWHPVMVSVGASGAIFGIYGLMLALMILKAVEHELRGIFLIVSVVFIGYNLLMGAFGHGVDNAAHIGGLFAGFLIGLVMSRFVKKVRRSFQ